MDTPQRSQRTPREKTGFTTEGTEITERTKESKFKIKIKNGKKMLSFPCSAWEGGNYRIFNFNFSPSSLSVPSVSSVVNSVPSPSASSAISAVNSSSPIP
jgi:hypothetical protein